MAIGSIVFLNLVVWLLLSFAPHPAQACTLFAALGSSVSGGGTIIAKNRDRCPLASGLKVFVPPAGYRHLGLVSLDSPNAPAVAGINEKGLVVVDASPSSLDLQEEDCRAIPLTQALLTRCASVAEVLAQKELLSAIYPVFEMVADRRQVAVIEVAPGGQVSIQVSDQGTLCHTNHYLSSPLLWANQRAHPSSKARFCRIKQLLDRQGGLLLLRISWSSARTAMPARIPALTASAARPEKPAPWQPSSCNYPMTHHTSSSGCPTPANRIRLSISGWNRPCGLAACLKRYRQYPYRGVVQRVPWIRQFLCGHFPVPAGLPDA
jgi:hypothetical protein